MLSVWLRSKVQATLPFTNWEYHIEHKTHYNLISIHVISENIKYLPHLIRHRAWEILTKYHEMFFLIYELKLKCKSREVCERLVEIRYQICWKHIDHVGWKGKPPSFSEYQSFIISKSHGWFDFKYCEDPCYQALYKYSNVSQWLIKLHVNSRHIARTLTWILYWLDVS